MVSVKILEFNKNKKELDKIIQRSGLDLTEAEIIVKEILKRVKNEGNPALYYYTDRFDNVQIRNPIVSQKEIEEAYSLVSKKEIGEIKNAAKNIKEFAEFQMPKPCLKEISPGIKAGVKIIPLDSVGCYVPGGKYPLPSTTLMTVIPAKVAGVQEIIVATPPQKNGKANSAILVAADLAGATKIVKIGGAQAIAAMAYGTQTIPKVNKIVGPGNIYVTAAKKLLYGEVGIDMLAGPSEVVIIAQEKANPRFIASDMLAQAEHDTLACGLLFTDSKELAEQVRKEIESQIETLTSKKIINESFKNYSCIVLVDSVDQAIEFSNSFAPEHLELVGYDVTILNSITNAGSIFFGKYSCEAAGDYCSGPNHVLPTGQSAKIRAGLSVYDFVKMPTVQILTKEGLESLKDTITTLAELENLPAHANSAKVRFENRGDKR